LNVSGTTVKLGSDQKTSNLQVFIDHALLEVFVNGGKHCVTRVIDPVAELKSDSGQPAKVWNLKSIW
jgi:sucrose-6-phosphate hydrolase SacC (GH32 family)